MRRPTIMHLFTTLSFFLVYYTTSAEADLIPRAFYKAHHFALRHTHSFAQDLRVAFGGGSVSGANTSSSTTSHRVVYCKPKQVPFGINPGAGGNNETNTSMGSGSSSYPTASGTKTTTGPNPTSTTSLPDSPWKLSQSYVRSFLKGFRARGGIIFDEWS